MRYRFILAEKAHYPVRMLCRVLAVSPSGFYAWCHRAPSRRRRDDGLLKLKIAAIYQRARGTYGSPRIHVELQEQGVRVSRKRVARLMSEVGLEGTPRKRFRRTTDSSHRHPIAANVLDRQFSVVAPNRVWATDITYVRTWEGWLYLAVIVDLFSRRVVGWALDTKLHTALVVEALDMALGLREPGQDLLHHSDRGSQYASTQYRELLEARKIRCSMSRRGDCWDNAVVESFFGTLKTELIDRRPWPTRRAAQDAIREYIEIFYNRQRRHSSLGYKTPAQFEELANLEILRAA